MLNNHNIICIWPVLIKNTLTIYGHSWYPSLVLTCQVPSLASTRSQTELRIAMAQHRPRREKGAGRRSSCCFSEPWLTATGGFKQQCFFSHVLPMVSRFVSSQFELYMGVDMGYMFVQINVYIYSYIYINMYIYI